MSQAAPGWPAIAKIVDVALRKGRNLSSRLSIRRIKALDDQLGAFLHVADLDVESIDDHPKESRTANALFGVPIAIKDNIAVHGMPMTCGSKVLEGFMPPTDATVARRLRDVGAVIVGKTNMDEFAMGSSTETSALSQCRNPWDVERVPGGSSGGSAAATAAAMVPLALGSDTGGSVRQPAAFTGLVGFKPSYGAVSRRGLVAYGSSLDQIGFLGTRVADVEVVFEAVRGQDPLDPTTQPASVFAGNERPGPRRVGIIKEYCNHPAIDEATSSAVNTAIEACRSLGHDVIELSLPNLEKFAIPAYYLTACAEASSNLARFDGVRYGARGPEPPDTVDDLVKTTRSRFGPEVKLRILLGTHVLRAGHYEHYYGRAQQARARIATDLKSTFESIDFLLTPTAPTQAFSRGEFADDPITMKLADLFTVPANLAGLPAISVPVGISRGLPTAVQLMAHRFADAPLLQYAGCLEKRLGCAPLVSPIAGQGPEVQIGMEPEGS